MRLIDADALLESAGIFEAKACARGCGKSIMSLAKTWLFNEVSKAPTIDAVPVVQLRDMLSSLERKCCGGDEGETYTTGYRNGHYNGQVELLRHILQVPDGTSEGNEKDGDGE